MISSIPVDNSPLYKVRKIVLYSSEGANKNQEYYFDENEKLIFMFAFTSAEDEERFYYYHNNVNIDNMFILLRYIDEAGTIYNNGDGINEQKVDKASAYLDVAVEWIKIIHG